jgi:hypothetical protein
MSCRIRRYRFGRYIKNSRLFDEFADKVGDVRIKQERAVDTHARGQNQLAPDTAGIVEQDEMRAFLITVCKLLRIQRLGKKYPRPVMLDKL